MKLYTAFYTKRGFIIAIDLTKLYSLLREDSRLVDFKQSSGLKDKKER